MSRHSGFTLVELLVSMAIFAVITGFVMANFRAGSQGDEIRLASQIVASEVRRAQTQALAGQMTKFCREAGVDGRTCESDLDCGDGACVSDVPRGGYGLHLSVMEGENRAVILFADTNVNYAYDAGEQVRRVSISPNVFVNVTGVEPMTAQQSLDIVFTPPKPTVRLNGSVGALARITLTHRSTQAVRSVTVNALSGQVSAE